jgi:hypothetical protein
LLEETKADEPTGGDEMRLTHRHRNQRRRTPRIEISQAEITADLHYPAGSRAARQVAAGARRIGNR